MPGGDWLRWMGRRCRAVAAAGLWPWPWGLMRLAVVLGLAALFAWSFERGVAARRWTWDYTQPFRFTGDINRGYTYGRRALREGFVDLYSRRHAETTGQGQRNDLNYAPLRLAVMTWYAWTLQDDFPDAERWQREPYAFTAPVLRVNIVMELATALGTFVLVVLWIRRATGGREASDAPGCRVPIESQGRGWFGRMGNWFVGGLKPFHGWLTATLAAGLVWFNPASWINAHGWPLWDIWVPPFVVWALVFITLDRWLAAGLVIGLGAMFKGQQFLVAPLFVMTALFLGRPGAAARWLAGLLLGMAVVISPWMLAHRFEATVPEGASVATLRDPDSPLWNGWALAWVGAVAVVFGSIWLISRVRRWWIGPAMHAVTATAVSLALIACVPLFDADTGWLRVGLLQGTEVFPTMYVAGAYNVPALLDQQFGFSNRDDLNRVLFSLGSWPVTLKALSAAVYFVMLVLCSIGAARHWRRHDPRALVALIAPWLLMFTFVTQMHERYLLFAAVLSAALIAVRWPYLLMCGLLSFLTVCMTADTMFGAMRPHLNPRRGWPMEQPIDFEHLQFLHRSVRSIFPGAAWAVVVCCVLMLLDALGLGRVRFGARSRLPAADKATTQAASPEGD